MSANFTPYVRAEDDGSFTLTEQGIERGQELIGKLHDVVSQEEELTFLDALLMVDLYKGMLQQVVEKQLDDLATELERESQAAE